MNDNRTFSPLKRLFGQAVATGLLSIAAVLPLGAQAGTATYKYDNLGRLTQIDYDGGVMVKYTYDANGNRATEVVTGTKVLSPEVQAALIAIILQLLLDD